MRRQLSRRRKLAEQLKPDASSIRVVMNAGGQEKATERPGDHYPFMVDRLREISPTGLVQKCWVDRRDPTTPGEFPAQNITSEGCTWQEVVQYPPKVVQIYPCGKEQPDRPDRYQGISKISHFVFGSWVTVRVHGIAA